MLEVQSCPLRCVQLIQLEVINDPRKQFVGKLADGSERAFLRYLCIVEGFFGEGDVKYLDARFDHTQLTY